ncbi:MAG: hypothetical protein ACFE9T_11110 [Promethearchaeota archaeon]
MKTKYKLVSVCFIGILFLFLTSIKVSVAQTPNWIGVEAGDKFNWKITLYFDTYMELEEDMTGVPYVGPSQPDLSIGFSLEVLAVSNELFEPINGFYFVNVTTIMTISMPGYGEETSPPIGQIVPRNDTLNYFGTLITFINQSMGSYWGLFIVATDLDWGTIASELDADFPEIPEFPAVNFEITARERGFELYFSGGTFGNVTLQAMTGYVDYNTDGVINTGVFKYGGSTLASITSGEEEEIPGYELSMILIVTVLSTVGLIIYIRKKKKI